jgi:ABC-type amino acid transport substrate-binding protein
MKKFVYHHMKKSLGRRLTVLALLCSAVTEYFPVQAENGTHGPREIINVGFFAFDGYHMEENDGSRSGYGYDFLQKLSTYTGWTYNYIGYDKSWSDMQTMLLDGTIDMVTSAQKTEERQKQFAFSDKSIGTNTALLTVKSGNQKYTAGDYATYNNMRIGILNSSSRNDKLASFAKEKGFTYTTVTFDSSSKLTAALQTGDVDALFTSSLRVISNEWILD